MRPSGYKADEYIHYIQRPVKSEDKTKMELYEIPFEEIERMNLNKVGNEISYTNMNVVNLERYMLYYWIHIIGSDCILLYLHLWDFCNKDEGVDICYPKMTELEQRMGLSRPTLIKKIKTLEENNFLIQIHRINKQNKKETSPIFKLRQTIPLLSKEQYHKLPKLIQKKHDEYMDKFASDRHMEWFNPTGKDTREEMIQWFGDPIITKKMRQEMEKTLRSTEAEEFIRTQLPDRLKETLHTDQEIQRPFIEEQIWSKPTAELYFKDLMSTYIEETATVHLIARDKEQKNFLEEVIIINQLNKLVDGFHEIYPLVKHFQCFTRDQYVIKIKKGM